MNSGVYALVSLLGLALILAACEGGEDTPVPSPSPADTPAPQSTSTPIPLLTPTPTAPLATATAEEREEALDHFNSAVEAIGQNQLGTAAFEYDLAVELDPEFTAAYIGLGMLHFQLQEW